MEALAERFSVKLPTPITHLNKSLLHGGAKADAFESGQTRKEMVSPDAHMFLAFLRRHPS
jgi:hypothetical protein